MSQLEDLLKQCTVKLTLTGGWGTGFFVSPGLILTCAHVVRKAPNNLIEIFWPFQDQFLSATLQEMFDDGKTLDIALLALAEPYPNHCCVFLDEASVTIGQPLYSYGYLKSYPKAAPVRCISEGLTGDTPPLLKFQAGQIEPGLSGAALIDLSTGKVCGMVKESRDSGLDLGGGAVPTSVILAQFPELMGQQQLFHQRDQRWTDLVAELSSEASQGKQTVKKILMLSANPENPVTRSRRKEISEITSALNRAAVARWEQGKNPTRFKPHDGLNIKASISQELSTIEPYIVHISGSASGIEGLILEGNSGRATSEKSEKLIANLFQDHVESIQCIILNGCYSDVQAREIVQHIEFVIGISQDLEESKVIKFLDDFYFYIGSERTIEDSYQRSYSRLNGTGIQKNLMPILLDKSKEKQRRAWESDLLDCEQKIEKNPDNPKLWLTKARLLTKLGYFKQAHEAYKKASSLAPNDPKIRIEQADALQQSGNHKKAVNVYDEALELEPEDYKIWWKKGQAHVKAEEYKEAAESYERAIDLAVKHEPSSPDRYMICREYASLLEKRGEYQKSIAMYKKSLGFESKYRASSYLKRQVYKKMYSDRG
jgi:tetratricopeptide (TPR) repeat protein